MRLEKHIPEKTDYIKFKTCYQPVYFP